MTGSTALPEIESWVSGLLLFPRTGSRGRPIAARREPGGLTAGDRD